MRPGYYLCVSTGQLFINYGTIVEYYSVEAKDWIVDTYSLFSDYNNDTMLRFVGDL